MPGRAVPDPGLSDYPQSSGGNARPVHWRGLMKSVRKGAR
jgi:hypothetical protein